MEYFSKSFGYLLLCIWCLLLPAFSIAQEAVSKQEILEKLPAKVAAEEIEQVNLIEAQLKRAFVFEGQTLEAAMSLINQVFAYQQPDAEVDQKAMLDEMIAEIVKTCGADEALDSLGFARFRQELRAVNNPKTSATFEQRQAQIGIITGHYLMDFFYRFPSKAQADFWPNYLSGQVEPKTPAEALGTPIQDLDRLQKKVNNLSMWNMILGISCLLLLIGLVFIYLNKANKSALPAPGLQGNDLDQALIPLQSSIDELKAEQSKLPEELIALIEEKIGSRETTREKEQTKESDQEEPLVEPAQEEEVIPVVPAEEIRKTFYSVAPKNGIFFGRQLDTVFKSREHIYRIEVLDDTHAYYYLVEDEETRQHAYNIPDSYILPAMEVEGTGRLADATQINSARGKLKKMGNNWQIEEKAILKIER